MKKQTELSQFLSELNKESDRDSVLMASSIFDEWLCEIIHAHYGLPFYSRVLMTAKNAV
ncbi:hypothetical protein [Providencia sp.]|uniref:hypothetical protein n=1 Tax=Providencia sp. TaxID=589 RepID=UPI003F954AD3